MKTIIDWPRFIQLQPSYLYDEIFTLNEYRLIESEIEDRIIFDVGANIGMFSALCLTFGAKQIFAVEAQPSIFKWGLEFNMRLYPQVKVINRAILKNDFTEVFIPNNFIASRLDSTGESVKTMSLKTLFKETNSDDFVLKMDIEGSEYDAILSSDNETIKRCKFIHMEFHPNVLGENSIRQKIYDCNFKQVYTARNADGSCSIDKWIRN